jgi:hypothetical protein
MTLSQFNAALDRWGADLARWPESERDAANALLTHSAEAGAVLAGALQLDAFMRTNDPARAMGNDALVRVMNSVMANLPKAAPARRRKLAAFREWLGMPDMGGEWLPRFAVSMTAAVVLGLVVSDHLAVNTVQYLSPIEALANSNSYLPMDLQ